MCVCVTEKLMECERHVFYHENNTSLYIPDTPTQHTKTHCPIQKTILNFHLKDVHSHNHSNNKSLSSNVNNQPVTFHVLYTEVLWEICRLLNAGIFTSASHI